MKTTTILAILAITAAQASAVPEAEPRRHYGPAPWSSCGFPGEICSKTKRAAMAVAEALAEPRRHYGPAPWSSCGFPGEICSKAKRSLEELGTSTEQTLDNILDLDKDDDASAYRSKLVFPTTSSVTKREARHRGPAPWSSCGFPGEICSKAKRGVELIKEDFPNIHKDECFAEGGECDRLLKARAAFDEAVKAEPEPKQKCVGPKCEKAEKYFKHLDDALTKATEEVLKN